MSKQSAISSQPSALEEVLKKEWKELTPLERVLITAHELDLHDDERQDVIEPAAAELQRLRAVEVAAREAKNKLDVFMQEVVKADVIVPLWAGILYDELEAALNESETS